MSDSESTAALIEQLQQTRVDNAIIFGLSALVFYEYLITLKEEVDIVWRRRWNAATVLFMVNRYLMVVYNAVGNVVPTTQEILLDVLTVLQFVVFAVFAALRIYAIWDRSIPLALLVFALNLVPVVANTYDFATDTVGFFVDPLAGAQCFEASKLSDALNFRLSTATRVALMVADALVLFLTWRKTFGMRARAQRLGLNLPFVALLIRDGTVYFMALLAMNIAQIVMKEFPEFSAFPPTILFINSLTPVLISRFLINLRAAASVSAVHSGPSPGNLKGAGSAGAGAAYSVSAVSTMQFSGDEDGTRTHTQSRSWSRSERVIGPMGEELADGSLYFGSDGEEDGAADGDEDLRDAEGSAVGEKMGEGAEIQEVSRVDVAEV